ncbi:MAG: hypothetical protein JEZ00_21725 [Anaerolineaceae bacterium]|nr:hypothetical protein [Anaerolineaceae bacterium]
MSKLFIDPKQPLLTCKAQSCEGCPVGEDVVCHFNGSQLIHFLFFMMPAFLLGGRAIFLSGIPMLLIWIGLIVGYFLFTEIRVMCSHCPHYAEEGASLQCWANYGASRLWKYRPGPMSITEKIIFFAGLALVMLFPMVFFIINTMWFDMILYIMIVTAAYLTMRNLMCNHCMNFACPLNIVSKDVREKFFERNPVVAEAWQSDIDISE